MHYKHSLYSLCVTAISFGAVTPHARAADTPAQEAKNSSTGEKLEAEIALSTLVAESARNDTSEDDRSRIGALAEMRYIFFDEDTEVAIETKVEAFDYVDDGDNTRFSVGATAEVRQSLTNKVKLELRGGHMTNLVTLESQNTDQSMARAAVILDLNKTSRFELAAGHRWRHYDDNAGGNGEGWQVGGKYRHRFGANHIASVGITHDEIKSTTPIHSYKRNAVAFDYSMPVAKHLRLVAGLDAREARFTGRPVGNIANAPNRKDRLIRPEIGLSYGKSTGLYARATAGYDLRSSNDARYRQDSPRLTLKVGWRF